MYLIGVLLTAPRSASRLSLSSAVIADMVWLLATGADNLEHVRAHTAARHISLVLFLNGEDVDAAERSGRQVGERLTASLPRLAGWEVLHCWPLTPDRSVPDR